MWEKPPELMTDVERADASTSWKEYTAKDGRKYYYNKDTKESKWTVPEELAKARAAAQAAAKPQPVVQAVPLSATPVAVPTTAPVVAAVPAAAAPEQPPVTKPPPTAAATAAATTTAVPAAAPAAASPVANADKATPAAKEDKNEGFQYATKAEAKEGFKGLLRECGVNSDWSWEQAMRKIVSDKRYGALKSLGEKKACFNEYLQQRKREEREEARQRLRQARDDFTAMLEESTEVTVLTKFTRAVHIFEKDPRWKAVTSSREQEELFMDHLRERDRKEREAKRAARQAGRAAFHKLLDADTSIKAGTSWRKVQERLSGEEAFKAIDRIDALDVFQEHHRELERREQEEKEREKEARRFQERKNRDAFTELLHEHKAEGLLTIRMRWKEYASAVKEEEAYLAVVSNLSGSRPRELFEDVMEEVEEEYEGSRGVMKEAVKSGSVAVTTESSEEAVLESLAAAVGEETFAEIPSLHKELFVKEQIQRAKEKEAKEVRRRKAAQEAFAAMLKKSRAVTAESTWEGVKETFAGEPEFKAVESDAARQALVEEHLAELKAKAEEKAARGEEEEERRRHKKDKRHKKSRRGSRSRSRSRSRSPGGDSDDSDRKASRKHKHKRHHSDSDSEGEKRKRRKKDRREDREERHSSRHKESKDKDKDRSQRRSKRESKEEEMPEEGEL